MFEYDYAIFKSELLTYDVFFSLQNPQQPLPHFGLSQALEEWIWEDNMNFIQDNNIFDHNYFNFMWQMVSYVPNTLNPESTEDITLLAVKLATSFFLESFIHAKVMSISRYIFLEIS